VTVYEADSTSTPRLLSLTTNFSFIDQALVGGSNFTAGILMARASWKIQSGGTASLSMITISSSTAVSANVSGNGPRNHPKCLPCALASCSG
jgi:hypothetical protein